LKIGFVLAETIDGGFVLWESLADSESYVDLYCLALTKRGHACIKYVPSVEAEKISSYRHKFGHVVKRVPVHHQVINPRWISRRRMGRTGLSTTAHQLQGLGFTANLLREAKSDKVDVLHYSSYYSSFFVPALLTRGLAPFVAQYSGGGLPDQAISRVLWRVMMAPSLLASSSILVGNYRSELISLRAQAGSNPAKIRNFDSPVVDMRVFRPQPREGAILEAGFEGRSTNILSVTFIPKKNPELLAKNPFALVSLFAEAKRLFGSRLTLYFAGFGPGMDELREHARAEGVDSEVKLLGRVRHDLLPTLYSASDLVFVPYPFEKLNEGSVTFEAFACGTPVAGWRRLAETPLEQVGGFLVDMTPASGAAQLVSRLKDSNYMSRKREECSKAGQQVSLDVAGEKLDSAYLEATGKAGRARAPQ
jgi:glycosyltransferase involved in cell wall biosynthesis